MNEKEAKFYWDEKEKAQFMKIKEMYSQKVELTIPDMSKDFVLESDTSHYEIGACLYQDGNPIAFISRTLNKSELNYGITEKEVLAALWSMERFKFYLIGKKFTLITDHKAMEFIKKKVEFGSQRMIRWFERLENFNFDVQFREGKKLIIADAMSISLNVFIEGERGYIENDNILNEKILKIHDNFKTKKYFKRNKKSKNKYK